MFVQYSIVKLPMIEDFFVHEIEITQFERHKEYFKVSEKLGIMQYLFYKFIQIAF